MHDEPALTTPISVEPQSASLDATSDGDVRHDSFAPITTGGDAQSDARSASIATGRYLLGAEIARGGMGAVYRATDTAFGREVAIKVLLERYHSNSRVARRFHDEAWITGQLQHPGIPPVHDLGTLPDGRPFLAMKLIKGSTLEDLLKLRSDPATDRGWLVAVFEGVCQAVAYAHAPGVVHRDLKPSNVMVGAFGEVQVMDWGLAKVLSDSRLSPDVDLDMDWGPTKVLYDGCLSQDEDQGATAAATAVGSTRNSEDALTQAGSLLGTPAYMPPEQAIGAVHEVERRSDVFGLGGILAAILTGQPPFVGDTVETTRVQAARGELKGCFERLDMCGAEPELVTLTKRCLAPLREDRPADAEALAREVAALRAAADNRARQAEVKLATAAAESVERQKRRLVWLGAAAALTATVVGGLVTVLAVQRRANSNLAVANRELAAKNDALDIERAKVEQRFDMARKAIAAFHTTIDQQPELSNEAFRPLRKTLLGAAAGFYRELETLLADQTDAKSRSALADGYFRLGELTSKIGDKSEALAVYRKALALRRELAVAPGADTDAQLTVAAALMKVGSVLADTGDPTGALREYEEIRDVVATLEAEAPSEAVGRILAASYFGTGVVLRDMGKPNEALAAHQKARDLRQKLVDAHPANPGYESNLADSFNNIGNLLRQTGKPAESLAAHQKARDLRQKLADAHPTVTEYQSDLAQSHDNIAGLLDQPVEKLATRQKARDLRQRLANAHASVTLFQSDLADSHHNIGILMDRTGHSSEALAAFENARDIKQKLSDANPTVTEYQYDLSNSHSSIGIVLERTGKPAEALAAFERARDLLQKLAGAHATATDYQNRLASSHVEIGNLLSGKGKLEEALEPYKRALELQQKADPHPIIPAYLNGLANVHIHIGQLYTKQGRFAEAFIALDAGLAIREKLVATDMKSTKYIENLGLSHAYRGRARTQVDQPKEAAADLRNAVVLWDMTPKASSETRFEQSRALAILAKLGADPNSGLTADESKEFADRAIVALTDAFKAGWSQPAELQESDFDAVRHRADFRKLQADVVSKAAEVESGSTPPGSGRR
jgi:serine/threonine protein kinase/tetratricopeptide (TPR) repeat protein